MARVRHLTSFALGASALLVAAMIGVLWLQMRSPSPGDDADVAPIALPGPAARTEPSLPLPEARTARDPAPEPASALEPPPPERLGPEMIVGRVVDADTGEPVTSFRVDVLAAGEGSPLERLLASHDRGERSRPFQARSGVFRLDRERGAWDLVVRAPGYLPAELSGVSVPLEDRQPIVVAMDPGPTLAGLVYDVDGSGIPEVPVFLHVTRLDGDGAPPERNVTTTAWDGRFRFSGLPTGTYAVSLLEPDNQVDRLAGILLQGGTVDVNVPLSPRLTLVVCVRDRFGRPIRDARVELRGDGTSYVSGTTLPSGQVTLRHLLAGEYTLHVRRDGYADAEQPLSVAAGSSQRVQWVTLASL